MAAVYTWHLLRLNTGSLFEDFNLLCLVYFPCFQEAIRDVHVKGIMYRAVEADIGKLFQVSPPPPFMREKL